MGSLRFGRSLTSIFLLAAAAWPATSYAEPAPTSAASLGLRIDTDCCDNPATNALAYPAISGSYVRYVGDYVRLQVDGAIGGVLGDETTGSEAELTVGVGARSPGRRFVGARVDLGGSYTRYDFKYERCQTYGALARAIVEAGVRIGPRHALTVELGLRARSLQGYRCYDLGDPPPAWVDDREASTGKSFGLRLERQW